MPTTTPSALRRLLQRDGGARRARGCRGHPSIRRGSDTARVRCRLLEPARRGAPSRRPSERSSGRPSTSRRPRRETCARSSRSCAENRRCRLSKLETMSGHSKWATTKHKKAVIDSRRAKSWAKLIKNIEVAAKLGGPDLQGNPTLFDAVLKAKRPRCPGQHRPRHQARRRHRRRVGRSTRRSCTRATTERRGAHDRVSDR